MTLNSSGPLSIGGSIVGESINIELGRAATQQSALDEYELRNLASILTGQIALNNFYGKSNVTWITDYIDITGRTFATGVAISGDGNTAAIARYGSSLIYIFINSVSGWTLQQSFTTSDQQSEDYVGWSIAISANGNTLVAGAIGEDPSNISNAGSVYVFTRTGTTWTQQQKLNPTTGTSNIDDLFGSSVDISDDGNTVVIGARTYNHAGTSNSGAAFIFTRSGSTWTQQGAALSASDKAADDEFGTSVAISGDGLTVIIGAPKDKYTYNSIIYERGAAYIFTKSGSTWSQQAKLITGDYTSTGNAIVWVGDSVDISQNGNTVIIGAPISNYDVGFTTRSFSGAAFIFTRSGTTWSMKPMLLPQDIVSNARFGESVSINAAGTAVAIGAPERPLNNISDIGALYIFTLSGSNWIQLSRILPTESINVSPLNFANAVSMTASEPLTILIAAPYYDYNNQTDSGRAYIFQRPYVYSSSQKAIFGYGLYSGTYYSMSNLVSDAGIVASDTTGVGTARGYPGAATYGFDKAIFAYGTTAMFTAVSTSNLVSNTGTVAADVSGVGTARESLAAASYGSGKAIFGYGKSSGFPGTNVSVTNLVSNTGVVTTDVSGVGSARYALAAARYGGDKAIFGYGYTTQSVSVTNLVSNTGVVATDVSGVGTSRLFLAAASYGGDKAIFGYGIDGLDGTRVSMTNLVSNTGVVATDVSGVGTARNGLAATGYGSDKALFAYGATSFIAVNIRNLVSNTGTVATDVSGAGTSRSGPGAASYSS